MNSSQANIIRSEVVDLRRRLQDVSLLLRSLASAGELGSTAQAQLGTAIRSLQDLGGELAAVCDEGLAGPEDASFRATRQMEARSEVESGEFDMHG